MCLQPEGPELFAFDCFFHCCLWELSECMSCCFYAMLRDVTMESGGLRGTKGGGGVLRLHMLLMFQSNKLFYGQQL